MGNAQSRFRGALIYVALNSIHHLLERSSKKVGLEGNLRMILPFLYSLAIIHAEQNKIGIFAETDAGIVMLIRTINPLLNPLLKTKDDSREQTIRMVLLIFAFRVAQKIREKQQLKSA